MSGLVVVSAMYLWRENGLSARERLLRRELSNSQAEIAKLIMKVINKLQCAPVPSWRAGTYCCKLYVSRINCCKCGIAGGQHAAFHAISWTSANHPSYLQRVYCDAFPIHTSCMSPLLFSQLVQSQHKAKECFSVATITLLLVSDEVLLSLTQ